MGMTCRSLPQKLDEMSIQEIDTAVLWVIGLLVTFAKPHCGRRDDGLSIGVILWRVIIIGWLFAIVGICFLGRTTDAMAWFDLWIKIALCFGLYRDFIDKLRYGWQPKELLKHGVHDK